MTRHVDRPARCRASTAAPRSPARPATPPSSTSPARPMPSSSASTVGLGRITAIDAARPRTCRACSRSSATSTRPACPIGPHKGSDRPRRRRAAARAAGRPGAVLRPAGRGRGRRHAGPGRARGAALRVTYEASRPIVDPSTRTAEADRAGRPRGDSARGDADAALLAARPSRSMRPTTSRARTTIPMEPHATVAAWDGDRLTLWSKSQFVVERAGRDRRRLRPAGRERAGDLPVHRRRLRHQPPDLAARHARGPGGARRSAARSSSS